VRRENFLVKEKKPTCNDRQSAAMAVRVLDLERRLNRLLRTTPIGATGVAISRIGLGCSTFGREIDEQQSFRILDYAFERDITFFDTAESYGGGQARQHRKQHLGVDDVRETTGEMHSSEKILGRWLSSRGLRKQVVVQTKVTSDFTCSHVAEALNGSLERLRTDYVDIYLLHKYDSENPLEEAVAAMDNAFRSRKARTVGCSNFNAEQLRAAIALSSRNNLARFEVVQPMYNLVHREIEYDLLSFCEQEGIVVTTYSPLGAGFLTGKYSADAPFPQGSRFDVVPAHADVYFSERNFRLVEFLRTLSTHSGESMARLAMGWVFSNNVIQSVLVGATTTAQIDNAIESSSGLSQRLLDEIEKW
jgi:aryl-alcohol dehydrogenase-like predicted oxidoreductase